MRNAKTVLREIIARIDLDDEPGEVRAIASLLLEKAFGLSTTDLMAGKMVDPTPASAKFIDECLARINNHEPVQYVLGEAFFYGRVLEVNPSVLIPRPETEEVVRTVLAWREAQGRRDQHPKILDIGTGSGCIAITLSLEWPGAEVVGTDVSVEAIALARRNAMKHDAGIDLIEHDILNKELPVSNADVVVSNPPYIAENEKDTMRRNVLDFEPRLALFVPDSDPLKFYKAISKKARDAMKPAGLLAMEINEKFGDEVSGLLDSDGWTSVDIVRDIAGKPRVVRAIHN